EAKERGHLLAFRRRERPRVDRGGELLGPRLRGEKQDEEHDHDPERVRHPPSLHAAHSSSVENVRTWSIAGAPVASITRRSNPSAIPADGGRPSASAASSFSSIGYTALPRSRRIR